MIAVEKKRREEGTEWWGKWKAVEGK